MTGSMFDPDQDAAKSMPVIRLATADGPLVVVCDGRVTPGEMVVSCTAPCPAVRVEPEAYRRIRSYLVNGP